MQTKSLKQIFKWPIFLGVLTLFGLVVALLEDGFLEDVSILALTIPIVVILYFYYRKQN